MTDSLSIVIPAYNEARCIEASLVEVMRFARAYGGPSEVIVVDDGSSDETASIVAGVQARRAADDPALNLIRHPVNRGKGAGIRTGFAHATGDIVLFTDADLSAPMTEAPRLLEPVAQGRCEIAIGSRALDPSLIAVRQSPLRRASGRVFNWLARLLTGLNIRDTQCGFKAFRRAAIAPALNLQRIDGFAFDVELLYLASRLGLRIFEVPVRWADVPDTKVSLLTHSPKMFFELCGIRWRSWRGAYPRPGAAIRRAPRSVAASAVETPL